METEKKPMQHNNATVSQGGDFMLYPNPVENTLMLAYSGKIDDLQNGVLEIYDIYGVKIKSIAINDEIMKIDISELSAGIYMCEILLSGKTISIKKLIKL